MDEQRNQIENLETLNAKCDEYLAGWKRAQADYVNLQKNAEREKSEYFKFAHQGLLEELLPAIDQFDMAMDHAPNIPEIQNWMTGLKAVKGSWESVFKGIGLEKVATSGAFDPLIHEAVGEEAGNEEGKIVRVVQSGWQLHGKLLRPAKVIIAKGDNHPEPAEGSKS